MSLVICHDFLTTAGYHLGYLADKYKDGQPIDVLPLVDNAGRLEPIPEVCPIRVFRLKIKARAELAPDEFEAAHLRRVGR